MTNMAFCVNCNDLKPYKVVFHRINITFALFYYNLFAVFAQSAVLICNETEPEFIRVIHTKCN